VDVGRRLFAERTESNVNRKLLQFSRNSEQSIGRDEFAIVQLSGVSIASKRFVAEQAVTLNAYILSNSFATIDHDAHSKKSSHCLRQVAITVYVKSPIRTVPNRRPAQQLLVASPTTYRRGRKWNNAILAES